jgi:hypothetical protein
MAKSSLVSIDPGECTGGAYFVDGLLVWAGVLSLLDGSHTAMHADRLAIEVMYIRPPDIQGASAEVVAKRLNDLLSVNVHAGQWIRSVNAAHTRRLKPHEWKGGLSKERHQPRILEALSNLEHANIVKGLPASKQHNVIDAIGIGLFDLGRMTRGGR